MLKHIHVKESHRDILGEGNVNWQEFFSVLKRINFEGNLVFENFSSSIPEILLTCSYPYI
ncbi:TIM barrel protein [Chryseobacterium sp. S0630]|uniref:TIM barrel protein n=1 Tax=Chryseobacterium sp. S0630 TaxID=2957803 RepID=UPI00346128E9